MNLFYAHILSDKKGALDALETHHASKVMRKQVGDTLLVTKGEGFIYKAQIESIGKKELQFSVIEEFKSEKKTKRLHLAVAPTKSNERFEFFLEKATELGIDEITPIISFNSERKVYKHERGLKIIQGGAKQSIACHWPKLNPVVKLHEFLHKSQQLTYQKLIAHCYDTKKEDYFSLGKQENQLILIGPEGDFSEEEVNKAERFGFAPISLGNKRLRTETAALAACFGFSYT